MKRARANMCTESVLGPFVGSSFSSDRFLSNDDTTITQSPSHSLFPNIPLGRHLSLSLPSVYVNMNAATCTGRWLGTAVHMHPELSGCWTILV
jgi:hypothetical protein